MEVVIYLFLALIGLISGFLGGLLGIGGGIFTVPAFLLTFYLFDFPPAYTIHVAIGTSLGVMIFTALSSTWAHFLERGIQWRFLQYYSPGIVFGVILGALIADYLPSRKLTLFFSLYIFCFGLYFIISAIRNKNPYLVEKKLDEPYPLTSSMIGLCAGIFSSVLGVGGAPVTIPFLTAHQVELKHAISTSAFVSLLVGTVGSLSYLYFGLNGGGVNESIGYLYLPGVLIAGIASTLSAPYGVKLAYLLPTRLLKIIFGIFLLIVSLVLISGLI